MRGSRSENAESTDDPSQLTREVSYSWIQMDIARVAGHVDYVSSHTNQSSCCLYRIICDLLICAKVTHALNCSSGSFNAPFFSLMMPNATLLGSNRVDVC